MTNKTQMVGEAQADAAKGNTTLTVKSLCDAVLPVDPTIRAVALTVYAEAAGSRAGGNYEEKRAIADAIYNRTTRREFKETTVLGILRNPYNHIEGYQNEKYKRGESGKLCQGGGCSWEAECKDLKDSIKAAEEAALGSKYAYLYWQGNTRFGGKKIGGTWFRSSFKQKPTERELAPTGKRDGKDYVEK